MKPKTILILYTHLPDGTHKQLNVGLPEDNNRGGRLLMEAFDALCGELSKQTGVASVRIVVTAEDKLLDPPTFKHTWPVPCGPNVAREMVAIMSVMTENTTLPFMCIPESWRSALFDRQYCATPFEPILAADAVVGDEARDPINDFWFRIESDVQLNSIRRHRFDCRRLLRGVPPDAGSKKSGGTPDTTTPQRTPGETPDTP